jgi:EAL domain-containing protein (putative c-di-GMP-specific phosphodiesterase class I)
LPVTVEVNISAKQFYQQNFHQIISSTLNRHQLSANSLQVEITESTIMNDPEQSIKILQKIKDLGIGIAIDDFGTGYSSLSYLQRLPVDMLKVDLSFVKTIGQDINSENTIKSIIALANSLNLLTSAEGVETEAQQDFLQQAHCQYLQGYHYGQPMPAKEMTEWLHEHTLQANNTVDHIAH